MKKRLLAGAASLVMAATPMLGVFATDISVTGDASKDVTVGQVDETIYSVDITWGDDMAFDWKYNALYNKYVFVSAKTLCRLISEEEDDLAYLAEIGNLFAPAAPPTTGGCAEPIAVADVDPTQTRYTTNIPMGYRMYAKDNSVNGKVKVKASFTAESDYSWVKGVFSEGGPLYTYANSWITYTENDGSFYKLNANDEEAYVNFHLETKPDAEYDASSVAAGDKIGTITLDITPDLN